MTRRAPRGQLLASSSGEQIEKRKAVSGLPMPVIGYPEGKSMTTAVLKWVGTGVPCMCYGLGFASGLLAVSWSASAQERPDEDWSYIGAGPSNTRYSPLDQINADNFEDLEVAWIWRGDNFSSRPDPLMRSMPVHAEGRLFTVVGSRRQVVAIDPGTGETLWSFREPATERWERSMRQNYGKGVAYSQIDGRGVIYVLTPGFFLYASGCRDRAPPRGLGHGRAH